MKLSLKKVCAVLVFTAFFSFPVTSDASAIAIIPAQQSTNNTDPAENAYNNPNLNEKDGFNESEYRRKIQQKPKKSKSSASKDLVKHNL